MQRPATTAIPAGLAAALLLGLGLSLAGPAPAARPGPDARPEAGAPAAQAPRAEESPGSQFPERRPRHDRWMGRFMRMGPVPVPEGVVVPAWDALGPERQQRLARFEARWDQMPASARVHLLERLERRQRWQDMDPDERERIRAGARHFHDMPPELREKARASFQAMRALPPEQRREAMELWRSLSPEQRREWLETGGPGLSPPPEGIGTAAAKSE